MDRTRITVEVPDSLYGEWWQQIGRGSTSPVLARIMRDILRLHEKYGDIVLQDLESGDLSLLDLAERYLNYSILDERLGRGD